ncbi:MAG: hypothetical protein GTO45_10050 [Candidatus Aminicenantes bacterium]|nr:hypothetical protein [Candidatus Aminicenantes bacterium]NIM79151.1 hypothetical protein [Candidatus Aminicenantes bacterium]NIN18436.1 hypothetical protein [Candidatus Aminicenantes bacterium]NIN42324.1 hypothetical protein [Candidatus Aminicenantes bacterium]NIN85090.1 hypothetical protein [Candidatus Aminicenantes bacterium]
MIKRIYMLGIAFTVMLGFIVIVNAVNLTPSVKDDPLVRMPGTQPDQGVKLEAPTRCLNCHGGYNQAVEPGYNWKGSMMAQASRDPMFWACMTVAGQDSHWAIGTPNAVDICERCHFPEGWLGGRSDPPNASAMTGSDFDGLHCDFCHTMYDPFYETTFNGTREGNDWTGYWDEATILSQDEATATYTEDSTLATGISLFDGWPFYLDNQPKYASTYFESGSGQYFVSTGSQKRAGFADAAARHQMFYSRYHKSKYFCSTCHDVSNPALANLGLSGLPAQVDPVTGQPSTDLITEQYSAANYFHVERTFSEFMLSAYGQMGGAPTNPEFQAQGAPDILNAAKCQDCHMRDVTGAACNKSGVPLRPDGSTEHPNSGQPLHDLTGGNLWISHILASLDPNGPVYDPVNVQILDKGPAILTLDLNAGEPPKVNGAALKAGSDRAKQQLLLAGTFKNLSGVPYTVDYNPTTGSISFRVQNNTGHKLISGFPEGRRMFVNIKGYDSGGGLIYEVNPYDYSVGTLKGLPNSGSSPALGPNEAYVDELVYEVHPSSTLTEEDETFHFVLATGRYKDNRIPPKGFDIANAAARLSEPVWHGTSDNNYFTAAEYAGGYDEVNLTIAANANYVKVTLYYQGTSREYIEFLRDEINGTANTLPWDPANDPDPYIVQTDPFFGQLKEWGNTIWDLWWHNHGLDGVGTALDGIVPFAMTEAEWGTPPQPPCETPGTPQNLSAAGAKRSIVLSWTAGTPAPISGYNIYYDQAGKLQLITRVNAATTTYTDTGLTVGAEYCYVVAAFNDCDNDGTADTQSTPSNAACAVPTRK